ncbi:MAG: DNA repair photolyase [Sphingobacteriales bacterium]|jgi:DNA repair photolyase
MLIDDNIIKGRGAQVHIDNPYQKLSYLYSESEGADVPTDLNTPTKYINEYPKTIVNKVKSPDIHLEYSLNPYQGCEHGCVYCYARNTHPYWGYNAGLDFEKIIMVKRNAPKLLEQFINRKSWKGIPIALSGNTDCYQPIERKLEITRKLLKVFLAHKHPVTIITKNSLILRDMDILEELNKDNLIQVAVSITTLDEKLRRKLEPRTASGINRLKVVQELSDKNIPVHVMVAPIIPGLNHYEIPVILKESAERGAKSAGYTMVRLNGQVGEIFSDWITKNYPDKAEKVLSQIKQMHGGKLNDSEFGKRMTGGGPVATSITNMFDVYRNKFFKKATNTALNQSVFRKIKDNQLNLF